MKLLMMIETLSMRYRCVLATGSLVVVFAVIGLATVTWAKHNHSSNSTPSTVSASSVALSPAVPNAPTQGTTLGAEHVTLRATGFEPAEITRPAGRFLLALDNRAGQGEMVFRLMRENGTRVRDLTPRRDKFRLRHVVDLPPGRYAIVEATHPDWICRITITAP
jgi:hypothetical protein